ncbi:uncharacterized protein LOC131027166 isoform X1 [Cryptomeria japonica]|uniref:uncharacterized protein LOC131027166 isoform X1 n=2 Tax=Cryptomeria japonica TaxID=3369 RepID=UPI0027DA9178|nr:uncharacterized protein LOC131027166 isoform X1 [Cryptomeria japonica]XP_057813144.2 uncharacterized protein LOC131027166 isoform X1 [Cryptomeria japonica]XP_057813145.2 uncharacterized protein LOC131027166 isoform X1 [Cryptomeria japonica]
MAVNFQTQIRDNTLELREFLNDLQNWEQSIKERDKNLKSQAHEQEKPNLPPVRGRVQKTSQSRRVQDSSQSPSSSVLGMNKRKDESHKDGNIGKSTAASHTYDNFHNKWEKFDVDAALREVDESEEWSSPRKASAKEVRTPSKSAEIGNLLKKKFGDQSSGTINRLAGAFTRSDPTTDAISEKEQGNEYFKAKKYAQAIDCYSRSIVLYPTAVAFANRAMAYIKIKRFEEAEYDCNEAINLDDRYVKAYSRRGTARRELGSLLGAREDFEFALRLEPENKELKKQYLEARVLYEKKIGNKLPEEKAPIVIQEVASTPAENISEKTQTEADQGIKASTASVDKAASSHSTISKDFLDMEVDSRKVGNHVKQKSLNGKQKKDSQLSAQAVTARAASRAMAAVAQNIIAPKTAYEFETMWKGFSEDQSAQSELLKAMDPSSLPKVFKDALSAPLLIDIIRCIKCFFMENLDFSLHSLENLTKVGRFDMTIMCLSSKDKAGIKMATPKPGGSTSWQVLIKEDQARIRVTSSSLASS